MVSGEERKIGRRENERNGRDGKGGRGEERVVDCLNHGLRFHGLNDRLMVAIRIDLYRAHCHSLDGRDSEKISIALSCPFA